MRARGECSWVCVLVLCAVFPLQALTQTQNKPVFTGFVDSSPVVSSSVTFYDGALSFAAHFAYQSRFGAYQPGVLILHAGNGLSDIERERANDFADNGFVGLAVSLVTSDVPETMDDVLARPDMLLRRIQLALDYFKTFQLVDPKRIALVGYKIGANAALRYLRSPLKNETLAGSVLYAPLIKEGDALLRPLEEPSSAFCSRIQLFVGSKSTSTPKSVLRQLEEILQSADADYDIVTFGGAADDFVLPPKLSKFSAEKSLHDQNGGAVSWKRAINFLLDQFGVSPTRELLNPKIELNYVTMTYSQTVYLPNNETSVLNYWGYFVHPKDTLGNLPVVAIAADGIGDDFTGGISEFERKTAATFAEMGYLGYVYSIFDRKVAFGTPEEREALVNNTAADTDTLKQRCSVGVQALLQHKVWSYLADPTKITLVGFDIGASAALAYAQNTTALQAVIAFYSRNNGFLVPGFSPTVHAPSVVMFGSAYDDFHVDAFKGRLALAQALDNSGAVWTSHLLGLGRHGFMNFELDTYNSNLAADVWLHIRIFLDDINGRLSVVDEKAFLVRQFVSYTDYFNNTELEGFLTYDPRYVGDRPGVMVVPDWDGLTGFEESEAENLAILGYVALAVNVYAPGVPLNGVSDYIKQSTFYKSNLALLWGRLQSAYNYLNSHPRVKSGSIAALGYCFGGTAVLEFARRGLTPLSAALSFHGGLDIFYNRSDAPLFQNVAIRVFNGASDPSVPYSDLQNFQSQLRAFSSNFRITNYGHTLHAFTNPGAAGPTAAYNARSATRAWEATKQALSLAFFGSDTTTDVSDSVAINRLLPQYSTGVTFANFTFSALGRDSVGVVAYSDDFVGVRPVVILFPDLHAVDSDFARAKASALVWQGYVVVVFSFHTQGLSLTATEKEVRDLILAPVGLVRLVNTGLARLSQLYPSFHNPNSIAVFGYGWGGPLALIYGERAPGVDGAVLFYPRLDEWFTVKQLGPTPRVIVFVGDLDVFVGPSIRQFQQESTNANRGWEVVTLGGTYHAFSDPTVATLRSRPSAKADEDAMRLAKSFLIDAFVPYIPARAPVQKTVPSTPSSTTPTPTPTRARTPTPTPTTNGGASGVSVCVCVSLVLAGVCVMVFG